MIKEFFFFFSFLPNDSGKRRNVLIWLFPMQKKWLMKTVVFCVFCFGLFAYCFSGTEQTAYMEETVETPEQPGTSEGEPLSKYRQTNIFFLNAEETINSYWCTCTERYIWNVKFCTHLKIEKLCLMFMNMENVPLILTKDWFIQLEIAFNCTVIFNFLRFGDNLRASYILCFYLFNLSDLTCLTVETTMLFGILWEQIFRVPMHLYKHI